MLAVPTSRNTRRHKNLIKIAKFGSLACRNRRSLETTAAVRCAFISSHASKTSGSWSCLYSVTIYGKIEGSMVSIGRNNGYVHDLE